MNLKKQSFLIILIGFFIQSFGQVGIFSSKTKWKSLKTNSFNIIVPDQQIYAGYKIMQYLNTFQQEDSLLGHYRDKRTYIIYGDHSISNGFVGPGPYRSGLYLTPPQNNFIGPGSWVKNLVNHENHHFIQHADARKGVVKYSFKFLGDFADSFLSNVYLLGWFWEGDAVYRESYSGKYGRGNYSHFLNQNRLFAKRKLKFSDKRFTYAYNKPYNLYIPNHYNLGYEMVNHLNSINQKPLYNVIDNTVGRLKRLPRQVKKTTGQSLFQHFEIALDSISSLDSKMEYLNPEPILELTNNYIHQTTPTPNKDHLYYVQHSIVEPAKVYDNQKSLFALGSTPDGVHRIRNNDAFMVWSELRTHPNFSTQSYSEIMLWDINQGRKKQLTNETKSFSPTIHPFKDVVTYLSLQSDYTFSVIEHNLSTNTKSVLLKTKSDYLRNLNYSEDGRFLTVIDQHTDYQTVGIYNISTQQIEWLYIPQLYQISNAFLTKNKELVLTADKDKYEHIYVYNLDHKTLKRSKGVTSAFKHLIVKDNQLMFDYQTINGLRNGQLNLDAIPFVSESIQKSNPPIHHFNTDTAVVTEEKYRDALPRLKFHSVLPYISTQDIQIELHANDFLRKNQLFYRFYKNYGSENSVHQAIYTYAHFPLHLSTNFTHSSSGTRNLHINNSLISSFQENKFGVSLSYPTSVVKSGYILQNTPSVELAYRTMDSDSIKVYYGSKHTNVDVKNQLYFAKNRGSVAVASPLYLSLTNRFATDFNDAYISENMLSLGFNLLKHEHYFEANVGVIAENSDQNNYRYSHEVVFPSTGYFLTTSSLGRSQEAFGVYLSDRSIHYKLKLKNTIAYPNMRFTDFIFLKRIHIEPFLEQSRYMFRDGGSQDLSAYGSRIVFDIQWVKSLPVRFWLTYAATPNLKSNGSFIGFGLVF